MITLPGKNLFNILIFNLLSIKYNNFHKPEGILAQIILKLRKHSIVQIFVYHVTTKWSHDTQICENSPVT